MTEEYKCGDNRFEIIAKAKADILEHTNIQDSPEEIKVLDTFLFRCWQMGWLKKYDTFQTSELEQVAKYYSPDCGTNAANWNQECYGSMLKQTLEQAAYDYAFNLPSGRYLSKIDLDAAFRAGAEWQKEQDELTKNK